MKRLLRAPVWATLVMVGCGFPGGKLGSYGGGDTDGGTTDGGTGSPTGGATSGVDTFPNGTGGSSDTAGGDENPCPWSGPPEPVAACCWVDGPLCGDDLDGDGIAAPCDNAANHYNPGHDDHDSDGFGDVIDLCPLVASDDGIQDDANGNGVGDECDVCRRTLAEYNVIPDTLGYKRYLHVRGLPSQQDSDGDGVGDSCDNCPRVPNCQGYGPPAPWAPGMSISEVSVACQQDADQNGVGDACQGQQDPLADGLPGFGDDDDLDQDGLRNIVDFCPRLVVEHQTCIVDGDCPDQRTCTQGVCNHLDTDGDQVGDACDTCLFAANPLQTMDGGAQEDDPDGDFVGVACETNSGCYDRADPRPMSFHRVSANGLCCVTTFPELGPCDGDECGPGQVCDGSMCALRSPDGAPIRAEGCSEGEHVDGLCEPLPAAVKLLPGVMNLPPGCEAALADAGLTKQENATPLVAADVGGDLTELWGFMCLLPQWDQDFDGIGDACDLCPFAFDPTNAPYVDEGGQLRPLAGKYCNGDYDPGLDCEGGL